ncbi:MAG: transporter [Pseudomonadota bacterium]
MANLEKLVARLLLTAAVLQALPEAALADEQQAKPARVDKAFEVQHFEPALGPRPFLTVSGGAAASPAQFSVGLFLTHLRRPFVVRHYNEQDDELGEVKTSLIDQLSAGYLYGWVGISRRLQLGASMPMIFSMKGEAGIEADSGSIDVTAIADPRVAVTLEILRAGGLALGATAIVTIPFSTPLAGDSVWIGESSYTARPQLALEWTSPSGLLTVAANAGWLYRKEKQIVYSSEVGSQLTYGVAAAARLQPKIALVAEVFGRKGGSDLDENPVEADGALRLFPTKTLSVTIGGGKGVLQGIGAPEWRAFGSVAWTPDFGDQDRDGVDNMRDRCPFQGEDRDGYQDDDGCPDSDNDGDFVPDTTDRCPNEAEDKDGWEDEDGCPDGDNDKDNVPDMKDMCPTVAEDEPAPNADGCPASMKDSDDDGVNDALDKCRDQQEDVDNFQDDDGCPELDNDADSVPDEYDECPFDAEDLDGIADEDGCPDLDNDSDGFLDAADKCPAEAEVVNGVADFDGCPDSGGTPLVAMDGDKLATVEPVAFRWDNLTKRGKEILDQAAALMRAQLDVKKWRIVVAAENAGTESATRARSQARADAVKAHLVSRGLAADTIDAIGALGDTPVVVIVATERKGKDSAPPAGEAQ